jgi:EAL domain-containing protein (putative c-di-GMP-specific phosphodiesterase class I)
MNQQSAPDAHTPEAVLSMTRTESGHTTGSFKTLTLSSHFQPIFSVAHNRRVGCEALLRPVDSAGRPVSPLDAFRHSREFADIQLLDRLARAVHLQNFIAFGQSDSWLFVNVNAEVFLESSHNDDFFQRLLQAVGFPSHRVVIEVLEQGVTDEVRLTEAVRYYRERGFLIALDDFGAGHSNFDRIWTLQPDIVKLDRSMITQAGNNARIRRMMPVMVSLLHEAGSMVLMEGIETASEALIAMDADADFVQGFFFARPQPKLPDTRADRMLFDKLWLDFREVTLPEVNTVRHEIAPYRNAIGYAASLLESGIPLDRAASGFLQLPGSERCYLLDGDGRQIGDNMVNPHHPHVADMRYRPLANAKGANWSRRFYFRRALDHPGRVQVTRPYLSIAGANQCITVSIGTLLNGDLHVLCGDVGWRDRGVVRR